MYSTFPTERLLHEAANVTVSLDPVLFFYAASFAGIAVLWTIGVLAFGRPHAVSVPRSTTQARITPVVP